MQLWEMKGAEVRMNRPGLGWLRKGLGAHDFAIRNYPFSQLETVVHCEGRNSEATATLVVGGLLEKRE